MNLTTTNMDLEDDQVRTRSMELNEFIVREGKFSYKSLIKHVTSAILMATVFLLPFPLSFLGVYTLIYTRHLLSFLPYMCITDSLYWSLSHRPPLEVFGSDCKAERILFSYHFIINAHHLDI